MNGRCAIVRKDLEMADSVTKSLRNEDKDGTKGYFDFSNRKFM